jgi:Sulfotransferase domain
LSVYLLEKAVSPMARHSTLTDERIEPGTGRRSTNQRPNRATRVERKRRRFSFIRKIESKQRELSLTRKIESKQRELSLIREKMHSATDPKAKSIHNKRRKRARLELFQLQRELDAGKEGVEVEPDTGTLPDFVIIGAQKGGTNFLYHLLTHHPLVEPAAFKEVHFFDSHFDKGIEWYCRYFPHPKLKGGRRTITGEATPYYLFHPLVAKRMAEIVPQARLIALLRNPVNRGAIARRRKRATVFLVLVQGRLREPAAALV